MYSQESSGVSVEPASVVNVTSKKNSAKALIQRLLEDTDIEINGSKPSDLIVHDERFYQRILRDGVLGLGESYVDGWWDCTALEQFFSKILCAQLDQKVKYSLGLSSKLVFSRILYLFMNPQNKNRAFTVGEQHYDAGNDLYQLMLDPTMSYSCGYWKDATTLADAQTAKLDLICRKLQLKPGMRVLDIGCGFGGMAKFAASNYQVEVVGVTISKEQHRLATERCAGLPVDIRFQDYRDLDGQFDRMVSIGMFEHVGPKNYKTYMDVANRCLKQDGLFLLHTIGSNVSTLSTNAWINKYIFPNGALPSIRQLGDSIENKFIMEDWHNFGPDYYKTLMAWHKNFTDSYHLLKDRYNDRFYRMWVYYLLSCAGSFHARDCQLWQVVLSKAGIPSSYVAPR